VPPGGTGPSRFRPALAHVGGAAADQLELTISSEPESIARTQADRSSSALDKEEDPSESAEVGHGHYNSEPDTAASPPIGRRRGRTRRAAAAARAAALARRRAGSRRTQMARHSCPGGPGNPGPSRSEQFQQVNLRASVATTAQLSMETRQTHIHVCTSPL
jgi:hypothetical protein